MESQPPPVLVVGGGFAGVECSYQLARRGHRVLLHEMRPVPFHGGAHDRPAGRDGLLELVPFGQSPECRRVAQARDGIPWAPSSSRPARLAAVPAGDALAVDRKFFAEILTARIASIPAIEVVREEVTALPEPGEGPRGHRHGPADLAFPGGGVARGTPGKKYLYFYDAVAPIVEAGSLDESRLFAASRYGKGGGDDYLNVPWGGRELRDIRRGAGLRRACPVSTTSRRPSISRGVSRS